MKIKEGKAYLSDAAVGPLPLHEGTKQVSMRELDCLIEYTGKVQDPNTTLSVRQSQNRRLKPPISWSSLCKFPRVRERPPLGDSLACMGRQEMMQVIGKIVSHLASP